jgi:hypothetical protein
VLSMAIVRVDGFLLRGGIGAPLSPHIGGFSSMGHRCDPPKTVEYSIRTGLNRE